MYSPNVDANNFWSFGHTHGSGIRFTMDVSAVPYEILMPYGGEIEDNNWHHIALVKIGGAAFFSA